MLHCIGLVGCVLVVGVSGTKWWREVRVASSGMDCMGEAERQGES